MSFAIVGVFVGQQLHIDRHEPAAAILTAERWRHSGVEEVRILWDGKTFALETFRKQFELPRPSETQIGSRRT